MPTYNYKVNMKKDKWNDVKECLPPVGKEVLVHIYIKCDDTSHVMVDMISAEKKTGIWKRNSDISVKHWMFIPKTPEIEIPMCFSTRDDDDDE